MPTTDDRVFNQAPPKTLFHYTNQSGLLGIVQSKSIWVTHCEYLNDQREFFHALDIVVTELEERVQKSSGVDQTMWQEMLHGIKGHPAMNVCVCSFSEDGDSLSQWRAYGGATSGYSLGIPGDLVLRAATANTCRLAKCIYDPDEQRDLVRILVEEVFQENVARKERERTGTQTPNDEDVPEGGFLPARLNRYAPVIKHHKFSDESEWRVISRPTMNRRFLFREGKSTVVTYISLPLETGEVQFAINEVVV